MPPLTNRSNFPKPQPGRSHPATQHMKAKLSSLLFNRKSSKPLCKACEGLGKSSRGKECAPCNGTGYKGGNPTEGGK